MNGPITGTSGVLDSFCLISGLNVDGKSTASLRAILFDFDGTLWDPEESIFEVYREIFRERGGRLTHELWSTVIGTMGINLWAQLERATGCAVEPELLDGEVRRRKAERLAVCRARPGVQALVAAVDARGLARGIVSNSHADWVERYSRQCDLAEGWAATCCADGDRHRAKPSPALYLEALGSLGVEPHEAVAFEDSPTGIRAAKRAGLRCVAVPNVMTARLDLSEADHRLDSFDQVEPDRLLEALAGRAAAAGR